MESKPDRRAGLASKTKCGVTAMGFDYSALRKTGKDTDVGFLYLIGNQAALTDPRVQFPSFPPSRLYLSVEVGLNDKLHLHKLLSTMARH